MKRINTISRMILHLLYITDSFLKIACTHECLVLHIFICGITSPSLDFRITLIGKHYGNFIIACKLEVRVRVRHTIEPNFCKIISYENRYLLDSTIMRKQIYASSSSSFIKLCGGVHHFKDTENARNMVDLHIICPVPILLLFCSDTNYITTNNWNVVSKFDIEKFILLNRCS